MPSYKLLIDTNVFIGLEDSKLVGSGYAEFNRGCLQHGIRLFVHAEAVHDIQRDKDEERRNVSLSKLEKFERISGLKLPSQSELEILFGPIKKPNDEVDVALLFALHRGVVDFLVTQDQGIHDRVKLSPIGKRVMRLSDALSWLRTTFEPKEVRLPFVSEKKAHEIDPSDDIFDSLREGYEKFDQWWRKCVQEHRICWTIEQGNEIAGICVRKNETRDEATVSLPGHKILKMCTFKVKPKFRGEKLGELLLKQALWFVQKNRYDLIYVATQPSQTYLIQILEYFGFQHTLTLNRSERVYEKIISADRLHLQSGSDVFELDRLSYPRFVADSKVDAYCVPIRGLYHRKLFPEIATQVPLPLFPNQQMYLDGNSNRTPGNTIRKVYLCRAKVSHMKSGDLLFFYESKTPEFVASQSITSVGVVEATNSTADIDELIRLTAKRSVFAEQELKDIVSESDVPVKVIDFLLVGHFEPHIPLNELISMKVFKRHPPQSITKLSWASVAVLKSRLSLGFAV